MDELDQAIKNNQATAHSFVQLHVHDNGRTSLFPQVKKQADDTVQATATDADANIDAEANTDANATDGKANATKLGPAVPSKPLSKTLPCMVAYIVNAGVNNLTASRTIATKQLNRAQTLLNADEYTAYKKALEEDTSLDDEVTAEDHEQTEEPLPNELDDESMQRLLKTLVKVGATELYQPRTKTYCVSFTLFAPIKT